MKSKIKIIHWVATGLLSVLYIFSASMYLFQNAMVSGMFEGFGFPTWVIYPLAFAKIIAVIVLWTKIRNFLVEWVYAGILFNLFLAIGAHLGVSDGGAGAAIIGLILWGVSYITWKLGRG